jgi:hypothetical protein
MSQVAEVFRGLRSAPVMTIAAIVTLGLGVAGTT